MPIETDNSADLQSDFALLESEEGNSEVKTPSKDGKVKVVAPEKKSEKGPKAEPEVDEVDKVLEELEAFESPTSEEEPETEESHESEEILPHQRPTIKQISEKFPTLFKAFPSLKDAWFRERQFSEVFHTPAEAKESAEIARAYNDLIEDVVNGTGEKVLPALKESDSLDKFAKNFLPNLYKQDKDIHYKVILPILEDSVRAAFREARRIGGDSGENLKNAALVLSNFLFGDMEVAEGKRTFVEHDEPKKDDKLATERREWENQKYNSTLIDVNEHCFGEIQKEIAKGFRQEDGLTNFMRKSITEQVVREVMQVIRADKAHMKYIDKLWAEAKSRGYRVDDKTRIINASLARAKSLIPSIRRKLIGEALGSTPSEQQRRSTVVETLKQRREPGASGAPANVQPKQPSSKRINWKKTSDVDFLNDKYVLK